VSRIVPERLVFIDESCLSIKMTRSFARSFKGERIEGHVPGGWGENLTVVGAMKLDGPTALMTLKGAMNGEAFKAYIENFLVPSLKKDDVVVMDNLSVHKVTGIKEMVESVGANVLFLPPYHPDLNPIEKLWSKIKTILRGAKARTHEALEIALGKALDRVYPSDAEGWFSHCGY
jgi:transposase